MKGDVRTKRVNPFAYLADLDERDFWRPVLVSLELFRTRSQRAFLSRAHPEVFSDEPSGYCNFSRIESAEALPPLGSLTHHGDFFFQHVIPYRPFFDQ